MRSAKLVLMAIMALSMTGIVACQSQQEGMSGAAVGDTGSEPGGEATADPSGSQPGSERPGSEKPGSEQPGSQPGAGQPGSQPGAGQPGTQPGGSEPGVETTGDTAVGAVVDKLNQTPDQMIDWDGIQTELTRVDSAGGAAVAKVLREAMTSPSAGAMASAATISALMAGEKVTSGDAAAALQELGGSLGDNAGKAGGEGSPADAVVIVVVDSLKQSPDAMVDWRGVQTELTRADAANGAAVAKALRAVMISAAANNMTSAATIKALMAGQQVKSSDAAAAIEEAASGIEP